MKTITLDVATSEKIQNIFLAHQQYDCVQDIDLKIFRKTPFIEVKLFKRKLEKFKKRHHFSDVIFQDSIREHFVVDLNLKKVFQRSSLSHGCWFLLFIDVAMVSNKMNVGLAYDPKTENCFLIAFDYGLSQKKIFEFSKELRYFQPFLCLKKDFVRLMRDLSHFRLEEKIQERLFEQGVFSRGNSFANFDEIKSGLKKQVEHIRYTLSEDEFIVALIPYKSGKEILIKKINKFNGSESFISFQVEYAKERVVLKMLKQSKDGEVSVDLALKVLKERLLEVKVFPLDTTALSKKIIEARLNQ